MSDDISAEDRRAAITIPERKRAISASIESDTAHPSKSRSSRSSVPPVPDETTTLGTTQPRRSIWDVEVSPPPDIHYAAQSQVTPVQRVSEASYLAQQISATDLPSQRESPPQPISQDPEASLDVPSLTDETSTENETVKDAIVETELEYEVYEGKLPAYRVYLIKQRKEKANAVGSKWRTVRELKWVAKEGVQERLNVNDIVNVRFDGIDSDAYGKVVEMRQKKSDIFIVLQWLYTQDDAGYKNDSNNKHWPMGAYILSNHFQVVTLENVAGYGAIAVNDHWYWDAARPQDLQPSAEIVSKLRRQLT